MDQKKIAQIVFKHGLGDCANFAQSIPLYTRRGYRVEVDCTQDKAPLFRAAGAVVTGWGTHHGYEHPPAPGKPNHNDHWSGNKLAWNLSRHPMPNIGSYEELWAEVCGVRLTLEEFVTPEIRHKVDSLITSLPRPLILTHWQGNTGQWAKDVSSKVQAEALRSLLDKTDGTVVNLDWDNRCYRMRNYRVRYLGDDLPFLGTVELYYLMTQADLFIGIDSGPYHLLRYTDCQGLGVWPVNYPSHFALPRQKTVNLVPPGRTDLTRYRRLPFNLVETDLTGEAIADQAADLLGPRRYLADPSADAVLRGLVGKLRYDEVRGVFLDRHKSFDVFLRELRQKTNPVVVETGCIRAEEDYTAGFSSYIFGAFLSHHGGRLTSVDLGPANVAFAKKWTAPFGQAVEVVQSHSHDWLRAYNGPPIDGLYLDSADVDTEGYQECCLEEARLALPKLAEEAVVMVDDSNYGKGQIVGKGTLAIPFLIEQGFRYLYGGYQVVLKR